MEGWESLIQTERATARLVAKGPSNEQVAEQMYVTAHIVAFHMRQIFRKLGISSRVELARVGAARQYWGPANMIPWPRTAAHAQAAAQHQDPWARASAVDDLGVLLSIQASHDLAVQHMVEALDGYEQAGATVDMARIRRRFCRLGVRRGTGHRRARGPWLGGRA